MLSTLIYYVFYSSVVLIYGIGFSRTVPLSKKKHDLYIKFLKMIICVSSTSALSYLVVNGILVPADLGELYPFVVILMFLAISVFIEAIIRITVKISAVESAVSLMFIFLGITESTSFGECVYISCLSVLSFFFVIPFISSFSRRMELNGFKQEYEKNNFLLISLAAAVFVLLAWNISWLNRISF